MSASIANNGTHARAVPEERLRHMHIANIEPVGGAAS